MKTYIAGSFTPETWTQHGRRWLAAVNEHKGDARVLVFQSPGLESSCEATTIPFDGTVASLIAELVKRDGVVLYAAPNVRLQAEPVEAFAAAADKFAVVERVSTTQGQPFAGSCPVYEGYWAAPCDLIDMLGRVLDMSTETGCKPPFHDANHVSYFTEHFPWFRHKLPTTEFMTVYDAQAVADYYADPQSLRKLTAVGLDRPETKKVGVIGSVVKPTKTALTTPSETSKMLTELSIE